MKRFPDSPAVVVFPPLLFGGTLAVGLTLHWLRPVHLFLPVVARVLGVAILFLSWLLVHAAEKAMKRAGTNIRPDQPTLAIVTDGPFRVSRNPMYLASTGLYLAVTLLFNAVWPLVLLPLMLIALHWGVIRREERYLEAKFGAPYREYQSRVPRWL